MVDTKIERGFGDARLAEEVIEDYVYGGKTHDMCVSHDGKEMELCGDFRERALSRSSCADRGIDEQKCNVLSEVLRENERDRYADKVEIDERTGFPKPWKSRKLELAGFSDEFIFTLGGYDGKKAYTERRRFLEESWMKGEAKIGWRSMDALREMGYKEKDFLARMPEIIELASSKDANIASSAIRTIYRMAPQGQKASETIRCLAMEHNSDECLVPNDNGLDLKEARQAFAPALPVLMKTLKHNDPAVRAYAARSLGSIAPLVLEDLSAPVEALLALLNDPELSVCQAAAGGLSYIGGLAPDVGRVIDGITALFASDDFDTLASAGYALGGFGAKAIPAILAAARNKEKPGVRYAAIYAMSRFSDDKNPAVKTFIPVLIDVVRHDTVPRNRSVAAFALGAVGRFDPPAAAAALLDALDDEEENVRISAAGALGGEKIARAAQNRIPYLIEKLGDPSRDVGYQIATAIINIGKPAIKPLEGAFRHDDYRVRCLAIQTLGAIYRNLEKENWWRKDLDPNRHVPFASALDPAHEPHPLVRLFAAIELGSVTTVGARHALAALPIDPDGRDGGIGDPKDIVRSFAASSLEEQAHGFGWRGEYGFLMLTKLLFEEDDSRESIEESENLLKAARELKIREAKDPVLERKNPDTACFAARALAWSAGAMAAPTFLSALEFGTLPTRRAAVHGLRKVAMHAGVYLGSRFEEHLITVLSDLLKHPDEAIRYDATVALYTMGRDIIGGTAAVAALKSMRKGDPSLRCRKMADEALWRIRD